MSMEHIPGKTGDNQKAKDELKILAHHHSGDLYDQDEDAAGEKIDVGTGRKFNNSKSDPAHFKDLSIIEAADGDVLPPIREKEDAAAKWLRENDPKYNG